MRRTLPALALLAACSLWCTVPLRAADPQLTREQAEFFEKSIRPVLATHCAECHGAKKQESGLRLDSREALLRGGERGPAAVSGDPAGSLLLAAVRQAGELKMPPEGKLVAAEVAAIERWVRDGLPWPVAGRIDNPSHGALPPPPSVAEARRTHWAFQPVRKPRVPTVGHGERRGVSPTWQGWALTPIDRFIQAKLESRGLTPSPPADRRTLIRRATFDLLGLPPTPEEVEAFVADPSPDAFARLVERLLASPHYGERWGRHWLDVARYADNKGYVFFEDKSYPWAYTYRDYVVRALNDDLPYDQFVLQQLAADLLDLGDDRRPLTALGFLTVGNRFMNNSHDILDDRIDVIARGLLGLTVTCARCHDHKYDPIPQADYYSLYGVLRSCTEPTVPPLFEPPAATAAYQKFAVEMAAREKKLHDFVDRKHDELVTSARTRVAEYLLAAHEIRNKPRTENFMLLTDKGELHPVMIERWRAYLERTRRPPHPVWAYWHAVAEFPPADFATQAAKVDVGRIVNPSGKPVSINPLVRAAFAKDPPKSLAEVAKRYGELFKRVNDKASGGHQQASGGRKSPDNSTAAGGAANPPAVGGPTNQPADAGRSPSGARSLDNPAEEELRQVLYGPDAPPSVAKVFDWGFLSLLPDRPSQAEFEKLVKDIEQWSKTGPGAPPRAMVVQDSPQPFEPRIFQRGNPNRPGDAVPRQFVEVLSLQRQPFRQGSGRLELARAIVDPANPLTARVIVNRVWMHHFGQGLVDTPGDFGLRSNPPSHAELLDYLAATFMERGWSLKDLHRRIMNSVVYQQASAVGRISNPSEPNPSASDGRIENPSYAHDPENRLLWRMNRRRLEFESLRDALLAVSGSLEPHLGGPPVEIFGGQFVPRRSIYGAIDRMDLPPLLSTFDFPSPATLSPKRDATTVPPQALFLMNHPFVVEAARRIAARSEMTAADVPGKIARLYALLFGRPPTAGELKLAQDYLGSQPSGDKLTAYVHGLLMLNEFAYVD